MTVSISCNGRGASDVSGTGVGAIGTGCFTRCYRQSHWSRFGSTGFKTGTLPHFQHVLMVLFLVVNCNT